MVCISELSLTEAGENYDEALGDSGQTGADGEQQPNLCREEECRGGSSVLGLRTCPSCVRRPRVDRNQDPREHECACQHSCARPEAELHRMCAVIHGGDEDRGQNVAHVAETVPGRQGKGKSGGAPGADEHFQQSQSHLVASASTRYERGVAPRRCGRGLAERNFQHCRRWRGG